MSEFFKDKFNAAALPLPAGATFYTAVPTGETDASGNPIYTNNYTELGDLRASLEHLYTIVTAAESPFTASEPLNAIVNTEDGPVEFTLPETPSQNDRVRIVPAKDTFETNPVTVKGNGNVVAGDTTDVELDISLAVEFVFVSAEIGWVLLERGETLHVQTATVFGSDVTEIRTDASDNVAIAIDDREKVVLATTETTGGEIQLPDSAGVESGWQGVLIVKNEVQLNFVTESIEDTILSLDNFTQTVGAGALIQILLLPDGVWFLAGGLQ